MAAAPHRTPIRRRPSPSRSPSRRAPSAEQLAEAAAEEAAEAAAVAELAAAEAAAEEAAKEAAEEAAAAKAAEEAAAARAAAEAARVAAEEELLKVPLTAEEEHALQVLVYLCRQQELNDEQTAQLLGLISDRPHLFRRPDGKGIAPVHWLCGSPAVTESHLMALLDSDAPSPAAATRAGSYRSIGSVPTTR